MQNNTDIKKVIFSRGGGRGSFQETTWVVDVENLAFKRYESVPFGDKDYDDVVYGKVVRSRKLRRKKECLDRLSKLKTFIDDFEANYKTSDRILDGNSWRLVVWFCDGTHKEVSGFCEEPEILKKFNLLFFEITEV